MIIIQTNRIFVVPQIPEESNKNIKVPAKNHEEKEQIKYSKKEVKYFIPKFYI
jgi:hypothetical protein